MTVRLNLSLIRDIAAVVTGSPWAVVSLEEKNLYLANS